MSLNSGMILYDSTINLPKSMQILNNGNENKPKRFGFFYSIGKCKLLHAFMGKSGLYDLTNRFLKKYPIVKKLAEKEIVLKIESIAGFVLFEEMFRGSGYRDILEKIHPRTFIDLGCNTGWFPCLLLQRHPSVSIMGLMIDADPDCIKSANWHIKINGLTSCRSLWGVIGCPSDCIEKVFYINPSNTQSSLLPFEKNHPFPIKGKVKELRVPAISVANEWIATYGNKTVDILKIDIEGAELDFLRTEISFISERVHWVVLEWHKWHVSLSEIRNIMTNSKFTEICITEEDEFGGVVVYFNTLLKIQES